MAAEPALPFSTDFQPAYGQPVIVAPGVARITARNASPYTFAGTNSFLLGESELLLVDPGPDRADHLDALEKAVAGRPVKAIVLTHTHKDHCGLARAARERFAAPIWSAGPHRLSRPLRRFEFNPFARSGDFTLVPDRLLVKGDGLETDAGTWRVLPTPGHCANHIALLDETGVAALVGDHVMGWNSTLVAAPDGNLADYFASLDALLAEKHTLYLPAHGGAIIDGPGMARALLAHRQMRNRQILDAVATGARNLSALTRTIYPQLRGRHALAARQTLLSHVEYLAARGELRVRFGLYGPRIGPRS